MKILQFSPLTKSENPASPGCRPETGNFETWLTRFYPPGAGAGPGGLVGLENRRARELPPAWEMTEAGQLLSRLDQAIRSATPEVLRRVHHLEGLLCLYRASPEPGS